ncbi:hypothetical protein Tco_0908760 [Tanacetum coccineum]|uniref:Uncharacterized protein n=1 Tax=Tanacetum coccineum TaxID=301880 RepID=A0ABQ5CN23_9ASTR
MLESSAYKTYFAFASKERAPKPKCVRKKADPNTSPKQKPVQATKGTRLMSKAKVAKPDKKKQSAKKTKAKGLTVLYEVMELTLSQRFLMSSNKSSGIDEGTSTIPGVPDVPIYESKSEKEYWGDSDEEDDDEDDFDDDSDDNDESGDERTKSDSDESPYPNKTNEEHTEEEEEYDNEFNIDEEEKIDDEESMDEEDDDEVTKELYDDVNVNLGNKDADMTNVDQGRADQQNVSQQSGFEQDEEDAHVTLTPIASLMETTAQHATAILEITSSFTTTVPSPPPFFNPLSH